MSFSKETKKELCSAAVINEACERALVYGMVLFSKQFSPDELTFTTESKSAAELYAERIAALTGAVLDIRSKLTRRRGESSVYNLSVPDSGDCQRIFEYFGHSASDLSMRINRSNIDDEDAAACFVRGVFLVCGSVSDPEKDYHLEFSVPRMNLAKDLVRVISEIEPLDVEPGIARRKGCYIVYIKDSDHIADMLTCMGAPMASLELVQSRIYKSVRNKVNRQINSETANSNKTAAAAAKQIRAIEKIKDSGSFGNLSEELRELAQLRLDNPEFNLRELGEALSTPISRSGVNHRLMRLMEIAEAPDQKNNKY